MKPEDLITYCGVYGGTCARWCDSALFIRLAKALAEISDGHGFQHWMPKEVKEFDYNEFRKGLDFFGREDSWLVCRKCCKGGDSNPGCAIRKCCQQHEVDICFECSDFPCDTVKGNVRMIQYAAQYRKLGRNEWLQQQVEKAKQGFELHTDKHYQIWSGTHPPTLDKK